MRSLFFARPAAFASFSAVLLAASSLIVIPAVQAEESAAAAAENPALKSAKAMVDNVASQTLSIIQNSGYDKAAKQQELERLLMKQVDVKWIARFVLGKYWRQATDAQRNSYTTAYEHFLAKHYAGRFAEYSSGTYKILDAKEDGEGEYTVSMSIRGPGLADKPEGVFVDYRLHNADGGLKVFDVIVEGVSLITTQRAEFAEVVGDKGIDHLITQLKTRSLNEGESSVQSAAAMEGAEEPAKKIRK